MALPDILKNKLRIPVVASPMFIISHPPLVLAQCKAGVVGSFPALNARPQGLLDEWLSQINEELAAHDAAHPDRPSAPFAVNQIVHKSNNRLEQDLADCVKHKVPIVPLGIVGCEETMPALANIKPLASLLAVPYVPLAFPIPLPARVFLNFGEPMLFDGDLESEEDVTVRVEQVKTAIRELIGTGLQQRQNRVY